VSSTGTRAATRRAGRTLGHDALEAWLRKIEVEEACIQLLLRHVAHFVGTGKEHLLKDFRGEAEDDLHDRAFIP
jgi:hypothetical protein